jgi:hypothetical protein
MNDQDHSLSLSDPDRSLVLSHLLTNFVQNLLAKNGPTPRGRNFSMVFVRRRFFF